MSNTNNTTSSSSNYVDPMATAIAYCETQLSHTSNNDDTTDTEIASQYHYYYTRMIEYIQNKLWHQCTIIILQYLLLSSKKDNTTSNTIDFYTNVIRIIQSKIHPLAYARMVVLVNTITTSTTSSTSSTTKILPEAYRTLKEHQQQALMLLNGTGGNSSSSNSRRDTHSNSNSNSSSNTNSIDYGTPTSYVEALLYIQCHQAMETMRSSFNNNTFHNNNPSTFKAFLQKNIYHTIIQPNATVIQDLISMTTGSTTTTTTTTVSTPPTTTDTTSTPPAAAAAVVLYNSTMVYSAYYEMTMMYDQYVTPYTATFFHHAIQYLQYSSTTPASTTSTTSSSSNSTTTEMIKESDIQFAIHLCWSAILGEGIYNLSYIMEHPFIVSVLSSITTSDASATDQQSFQFVYQLLAAMDSCQYQQYRQLLVQASSSSSLLVPTSSISTSDVMAMIREKFTLITLLHVITTTNTNTTSTSTSNTNSDTMMDVDPTEEHKEMTTTSSSSSSTTSDRTFTFDDLKIALHLNDTTTDDTLDMDLEMILMRAISIGLIRGSIDEVLQQITITYIQPLTTLTQTQLSLLLHQYHHWTNNIQHHITTLQKEAIATK